MKLVTAVVKPFKLDEVKVAVKEVGVTGMTVGQVRGFGRTGGHIEIYRGKEYEFDFIDKIQIEIVVTDEQVESVLDAIVNAARTDTVGDGKCGLRTSSAWCEFAPTSEVPKRYDSAGLACDGFGRRRRGQRVTQVVGIEHVEFVVHLIR